MNKLNKILITYQLVKMVLSFNEEILNKLEKSCTNEINMRYHDEAWS